MYLDIQLSAYTCKHMRNENLVCFCNSVKGSKSESQLRSLLEVCYVMLSPWHTVPLWMQACNPASVSMFTSYVCMLLHVKCSSATLMFDHSSGHSIFAGAELKANSSPNQVPQVGFCNPYFWRCRGRPGYIYIYIGMYVYLRVYLHSMCIFIYEEVTMTKRGHEAAGLLQTANFVDGFGSSASKRQNATQCNIV